MVTAWRMRRELGMEIAHRIYLYLVQKYPLGIFIRSTLFVNIKRGVAQSVQSATSDEEVLG